MTHDARSPRAILAWVAAAAVGLLVLYLFVRTADVMLLVFGLALVALVVLAAWVHRDATAQGMPALPWAAAVVLAPALGLVAYLVVRELRRRGT